MRVDAAPRHLQFSQQSDGIEQPFRQRLEIVANQIAFDLQVGGGGRGSSQTSGHGGEDEQAPPTVVAEGVSLAVSYTMGHSPNTFVRAETISCTGTKRHSFVTIPQRKLNSIEVGGS